MTVSYTSKIKGYDESKIAKSERNDCVVRALSSAFDIKYDKAHEIVSKEMKRPYRKGTRSYLFHKYLEQFDSEKRQLNKKRMKEVNTQFSYVKNGEFNGIGTKTVGRFLKENPQGTFLFSVRGHAFCVKDGTVVGGNREDSRKMRVRAKRVWQIFDI